MLQEINHLFEQFGSFTKENPIIAGVVSLWGLGVLTFILKGVPFSIFNFVKRQCTTTLVLNSQDPIYYDFLEWITKNKFHSFIRTLNFNNNRRGWGKGSLSIGYGTMFFGYNKRLFYMSRIEDKANQTDSVKEKITVNMFGRNHDIFIDLFDKIKEKDQDDEKFLKIYTYVDKSWSLLAKNYKRDLNTVIIDAKQKEEIVQHIQNFIKDKEWHLNSGVPYHTGLLLTGPSGTGKTSLIKGICSYFKKDLYIINLGAASDRILQAALSSIPNGAIVAIEDIDAMGVSLKRATKEVEDVKTTKSTDATKELESLMSMTSISGILNAIDGVASSDDRILIATTNYPEKLDEALIRDGRFNLKINIGYVTNDVFEKYINNFFPNYKFPNNFDIKPNIPMCDIQTQVSKNRDNPEEVVSHFNKNIGNIQLKTSA